MRRLADIDCMGSLELERRILRLEAQQRRYLRTRKVVPQAPRAKQARRAPLATDPGWTPTERAQYPSRVQAFQPLERRQPEAASA
jgi:hypothetical protein